ncbi:MAG: response regulator [Desulfobacula sp.]|nr:response regulator [Desulfobacula sp.]
MTDNKFLDLRRQAETLLKAKGKYALAFNDDPLKLIHELQTYQIELELQNEVLHQSQKDLMESKILYTELYDFAPVGYLSLGSKGLILSSNLTFADMLLTQKSYLINQSLSAFVAIEDQDIYYKYKKNIAVSKTPNSCELRLKKKDGTLLEVRLESRIVSDSSGDIEEYRIAIMDISDQKAAEKEKEEYRIRLLHAQKMEAIGTLAGGIAHDFNNILHPIIGFTQLSIDELSDDNPVQENLVDILQGATRASELVVQILAFSSQRDKEPMAIPPKSLIKETLKFLRSTIPSNIEIIQELYESDDCIMGNAIDIHEIIMNLCTNAYHAMEDAGGLLKVSLKRVEDHNRDSSLPSGDYCCLSISDTGIGIPLGIINQIFDPYFTTKEIGKGSGLGLSVVHGIVKKYNGTITVKSNPYKGTIFNIFLPITSEQKPKEERSLDQVITGGNERLLFVDDEKTIVKFGIRYLERLGYKVMGTTSSIKALEMFKSDPDKFDLVITDMAMPKMMGKELAQTLIDIRPDIPIIICTGYSDQIDPATAESIGIRNYIAKPIMGDMLALKVREILDK